MYKLNHDESKLLNAVIDDLIGLSDDDHSEVFKPLEKVLLLMNFVVVPFQRVERVIQWPWDQNVSNHYWNCFVINSDFKIHIALLRPESFESLENFRKSVDNTEWFKFYSNFDWVYSDIRRWLTLQYEFVKTIDKLCKEDIKVEFNYLLDKNYQYDINDSNRDEYSFSIIWSDYYWFSWCGIHENGRIYDNDWFDLFWFNQSHLHRNWTPYDDYWYNYCWFNEDWFWKNWYNYNWYFYTLDREKGEIDMSHRRVEDYSGSDWIKKRFVK